VKTSATITVTVDPKKAFEAFTEEIDLWYVRGPINYFDFARAVGMRCEPGVGGRLLEVYDETTGEGLELARITVWEPGRRLAWTSSIDEVQTEVWFRPAREGTEITVAATIADGARSEGGDAWVRIVPRWFPAWCDRRATAQQSQPYLGRLAVGLYYAKPRAAAHWLADVFGLEPVNPLPGADEPDGPMWIEFRVGSNSVILYAADAQSQPETTPTTETWAYVDDLDAHFAHSQTSGATIVHGITQHGYRAYTADDLEGHRWTFVQARPTMR